MEPLNGDILSEPRCCRGGTRQTEARRRGSGRRRIEVALVAATTFLAGCGHIRALRADRTAVRADLDSLKTEVRQLKTDMAHQYELLRLVRADQQMRFAGIEESIAMVAGNLTESQTRLSQIDEKTRELKRGWEEKARADSLVSVARLAEIEGLFDVAMGDYQAGRRAVALSGFHDIIKRFPDSPRAEESAYWTAECYYTQKSYDEATNAFTDYIKENPKGRYLCAAMLKLGLVNDKRNNAGARDLLWAKVIERCPGTDEAALARARMAGR